MEQRTFDQLSRGGARKGAGRPKPKASGASHGLRERITRHKPAHVTVRVAAGLPSLRRDGEAWVLNRALIGAAERGDFRIVEYSVMSNHVHLIVEANDGSALARGMQSFSVRMAKGLNKLWGRKGKVLADRFHSRLLTTKREVRNAIAYVLNNGRKHGMKFGKGELDPHSSAHEFTGWKGFKSKSTRPSLCAAPRAWLLRVGWRHLGLIDPWATPGMRC